MKRMKKFLAVLLAAIMVMSMGIVSVSAYTPSALTDGSYDTTNGTTLTITGVATTNHTFTAYQIFTGTLSGNANSYVLSDIDWGDCVDGDTLLAYLTDSSNMDVAYNDGTEDITWYSLFKDCQNAADVAAVLSNSSNDSDLIKAFADLVATNVGSGNYTYLKAYTNTSGSTPSEETDGTYTYTISSLAAGYYLVIDSTSSANTVQDVVSDYFLQVLGATKVATKEEYPSVTKTVSDDNETKQSYNVAAIGDTVTFTVTVSVPDISDYESYLLTVNDTLSEGLTFGSISSVTFTSNSASYTSPYTINQDTGTTTPTGDGYVYTEATASGNPFTVSFDDLYKLKSSNNTIDSAAIAAGGTITITYTATVSDSAVEGNAGNENNVNVTYSNNPNGTGTGTTTTKTTKTYTTELTVTKVDENGDALKNAAFTLYKKVTGISTFETEKTYVTYNSTTGTITTVHDADSVDHSADSTETYYVLVQTQSASGGTDSNEAEFSGLDAGDYLLVESTTPSGYNTMSPITFTLTYDSTDGWKGETSGTSYGVVYVNGTTGVYSTTIQNNTGSTIPTTGGMGTTILYIIGAILVIGAAVILVTRRRMANK